MVAPFVRLFRPIASLRPLLTRGLPQSDLDKLFALRARMDYSQGIPVNPASRPIAAPQEFSAQAFSPMPWELESYRIPSGVSPTTRPIPGRSIDDVRITPSIAESYEPRIAVGRPLDEPETFRTRAEPVPFTVGTERYTDVLNPIVPGRSPAQVRYMPLPSAEVDRISLYASEEPVAAVLDAARALDDAADPEQFAVALQAVRAVRRGLPEGDEVQLMMQVVDRRIMSRARELGIPEDVIEALPTISNAARPRGLYKESQELAEKGFNAQQQNAWPFLKKIRSTVRGFKKAKPGVSKIVDEDDVRSISAMLIGPGGGQIARMLRSGDIGMAEARLLHDEAVDAYILLSQSSAVNTVRNKGVGALRTSNFARMSDEAKTEVYSFAMQSADSPEEVAMISSAWRADITNPNYLDELELMEGYAVERLSSYARVTPWTGKGTPRARVDEESIESANLAIREDEARRAANEATRPDFPSEDVRPDETIRRRLVMNPETEKLEEIVEGGGRRRMIDPEKAANLPEPKNKRPWLMNFRDRPTHPMKPEFSGESTMDLVLSGDRTGTTRVNNYNVKVGDVIDFIDDEGRIARVEITKAPYQLPYSSDADTMQRYRVRWSELEGWDPSLYDQYVGQWQFQYKLLGEITV